MEQISAMRPDVQGECLDCVDDGVEAPGAEEVEPCCAPGNSA